jgi:hypothetical protein
MGTTIRADNPALEAYTQTLPAFDSFPYTIIRICPTFYQILLMPTELAQTELFALASKQVQANKLETCLALGTHAGFDFDRFGETTFAERVPRGGTIADHGLLPAWYGVQPGAFNRRVEALHAYMTAQNAGGGYLMGDLTKGGRPATPEELRRLAGFNAFGVPNGLEKCARCAYWAGDCLDPNPRFAGQLMRVGCLCANDNRCVRCGQLLYRHRLNANFFDESDGQVWHVAGFCGFSHKCADDC